MTSIKPRKVDKKSFGKSVQQFGSIFSGLLEDAAKTNHHNVKHIHRGVKYHSPIRRK